MKAIRNAIMKRRGGTLELLGAAALFVGVLIHVACDTGSLATSSTDVTTSHPQGGYLIGTTSSLSFATTVPPPSPPPTPPPAPTPDPTPAPAPEPDGKVRLLGILLGVDGQCPGCTLVTRRGSVVVTDEAELFDSTAEGSEVPIGFEELNALLRPGVPMRITAEPASGGNLPVADNVRVERFFATTGDIDVSSATLKTTRAFTLGVLDGKLGRVEIAYVLAEDAVVEDFQAGERVYVWGGTSGSTLSAGLVRRDD